MNKKKILDQEQIRLIVNRISKQLVEIHADFSESILIGLQPRGVAFSSRLKHAIENQTQKKICYGTLDSTFYRDDFRRRENPINANKTDLEVTVEEKKVIFVDDVLYTGRSVRAALDAIQAYGRPKSIELVTLIDRRFTRQLPIQANYRGKEIDSIKSEKVQVKWKEEDGEDAVLITIAV